MIAVDLVNRRFWAVAGVAVAVVAVGGLELGCTDKSVGGDRDAGTRDGALIPGCEVPQQQTVISVGNGPTVVWSLDVLPDGNYLVGVDQEGAGGAGAGLYVLDGQTLQRLSFVPVSHRTVMGRYDVYGDSILAVGTTDDEVSLLWMSYADGAVSGVEDSTPLCSACEASWSLPAAGDPQDASPLGLAVAVQHSGLRGDEELQVFLVDRWAPGVARGTARIPGKHPSLATGHWGYVLTYTAPSGRLATRLVRIEGSLSAERELTVIPASGQPSASVTSRAETINAVVMGTDSEFQGTPSTGLVAWRLSVDPVEVGRLPYEEVPQSAGDFWLSAAHGLFAVTWTDTSHETVAGAWWLAARALALQIVCGPVRVGGDLTFPATGQPIRTVSAAHPEGFVVIWSVAQGNAGDGLFGKIIPVTP